MSTIIRISKLLVCRRKHSRHVHIATAHAPCYILLLPVDTIVEILALLPLHTLLLASQTCRPLQTIVHDFFLAGRGDLLANAEPEERILYLTHLSRLQPDRWVCVKCCKLHQIRDEDTPYGQKHVGCADGLDVSDRYKVSKHFGYTPMHRHVQLALKYTRLGCKEERYRDYLERLCAFHSRLDYKPYIDIEGGLVVEYAAYPKVVNGRYLLLSIWKYVEAHYKLRPESIYCLDICPHYSQKGTRRDYSWGNIQRVMRTVFAVESTLTEISCDSCKTEFSIARSPRCATITIWQDFGSEGTIYDAEWGSLARDTHSLHHQPQTVRHSYGPFMYEGRLCR